MYTKQMAVQADVQEHMKVSPTTILTAKTMVETGIKGMATMEKMEITYFAEHLGASMRQVVVE